MIEVTEKAASELKTLIEQEGKPELALATLKGHVHQVDLAGISYGPDRLHSLSRICDGVPGIDVEAQARLQELEGEARRPFETAARLLTTHPAADDNAPLQQESRTTNRCSKVTGIVLAGNHAGAGE